MFRLNGKVGLVTGAGPNNGRAIALPLARAGAAVAVSDVDMVPAEETCALVEAGGGTAIAVTFDITDLGAVRATPTRATLPRLSSGSRQTKPDSSPRRRSHVNGGTYQGR